MALTREERRERRRGWIKQARTFWVRRGTEIEEWIERVRSAAPDINQDGVVSDEEVARYVRKKAKDLIPDSWVIGGIRVDSLAGGAVYIIMRVLLLLAKKKSVHESNLEEAAEDLNDEDDDITALPA
jgi:hypothetical protein